VGLREGELHRASLWFQQTGSMDPGDAVVDLVDNDEVDAWMAEHYPPGTVVMDLTDWTGETTLGETEPPWTHP
jgi:hypothetical protein